MSTLQHYPDINFSKHRCFGWRIQDASGKESTTDKYAVMSMLWIQPVYCCLMHRTPNVLVGESLHRKRLRISFTSLEFSGATSILWRENIFLMNVQIKVTDLLHFLLETLKVQWKCAFSQTSEKKSATKQEARWYKLVKLARGVKMKEKKKNN